MALISRLRRSLVLAASTLLAVEAPTVSSATPATGVSNTILANGTSPDAVVLAGRGAIEVTVAEITIAPGGATGWHYHDGELIGVVKSGTLTRTMHDCATKVTSAGGSFAEPAGRRHIHIGRNLGAEPVVLVVAYILPVGRPLFRDVPEPQHCDP